MKNWKEKVIFNSLHGNICLFLFMKLSLFHDQSSIMSQYNIITIDYNPAKNYFIMDKQKLH